MIDGRSPRCCAASKLPGAGLICLALAAVVNCILKPEQQAVEIDRHDFGGVDRGPRARVGEPARAEVPAAFGGGANIAVQLARRANCLAQAASAWRWQPS